MTLFLVVVVLKSAAQELNCKFTVNYSQIQGTSTQVFTTLENALMEFINTRRWTQAQYEMNERIRCSMNWTWTRWLHKVVRSFFGRLKIL